jgi:hypothetical protein
MVGAWALCVATLAGVVYVFYPDKPAVPRRFPGGLKEELGGEGAVAVSVYTDTMATDLTSIAGSGRRRRIDLSPDQETL